MELALNSGGDAIRARQGHSVPIADTAFEKVEGKDCRRWLAHGTTEDAWLVISREGLTAQQRQHVHLAQCQDKVREGSTIVLWIDAYAFLDSGGTLLRTSGDDRYNVTILSRDRIAPEFIKQAWHLARNEDLLAQPAEQWGFDEVWLTTRGRARQIKVGEWTKEYQTWLHSTDADKQNFPIEDAPDPGPSLSKREFNRRLSAWRVSLHRFQEWWDGYYRRGDRHTRGEGSDRRGDLRERSPYRGGERYRAW